MVKLSVPDGHETVSFGGVLYPVSRGTVLVPDAAVAYLCQYGFCVVQEKVKDDVKAEAGEPA